MHYPQVMDLLIDPDGNVGYFTFNNKNYLDIYWLEKLPKNENMRFHPILTNMKEIKYACQKHKYKYIGRDGTFLDETIR